MKCLGTRLVIVFHFYLLLFFITFLRRQIITNSIFQHPNLSYPTGLISSIRSQMYWLLSSASSNSSKTSTNSPFYRSDGVNINKKQEVFNNFCSFLTIFALFSLSKNLPKVSKITFMKKFLRQRNWKKKIFSAHIIVLPLILMMLQHWTNNKLIVI